NPIARHHSYWPAQAFAGHGADMERHQAMFIGFGEAGEALAEGLGAAVGAHDRQTHAPAPRAAQLLDFSPPRPAAFLSNHDAVRSTDLILSLVTANQALAVARDAAACIAPGTLFCDMNSVAPDTKRAAAKLIEAAGGRYVDVAVMAPVHPKRRAVP